LESARQNGGMKKPAPPRLTALEIRTTRILKGLRLNDIRDYTGIVTSTLSLVERGLLPLTEKRAAAISEALTHAKPGGAPRVRVGGKQPKVAVK
jgi:transcriptional regulator with XRE-family HTH domain